MGITELVLSYIHFENRFTQDALLLIYYNVVYHAINIIELLNIQRRINLSKYSCRKSPGKCFQPP